MELAFGAVGLGPVLGLAVVLVDRFLAIQVAGAPPARPSKRAAMCKSAKLYGIIEVPVAVVLFDAIMRNRQAAIKNEDPFDEGRREGVPG